VHVCFIAQVQLCRDDERATEGLERGGWAFEKVNGETGAMGGYANDDMKGRLIECEQGLGMSCLDS
jgi:hypothetical protein